MYNQKSEKKLAVRVIVLIPLATLATLLIITSEVFDYVSLAYAATSSVPSLPKFDPDFSFGNPGMSGSNPQAGDSQDNSGKQDNHPSSVKNGLLQASEGFSNDQQGYQPDCLEHCYNIQDARGKSTSD
jgi:hypothetical protein